MSVFCGIVLGYFSFMLIGMICATLGKKSSKDDNKDLSMNNDIYLNSLERKKQKEELEQQKQIYEIMYEKKVAELRKEFDKKIGNSQLELENQKQDIKKQYELLNEAEAASIKKINDYKEKTIKEIKDTEKLLLQSKTSSQKWLSGMIADYLTLPIFNYMDSLMDSNSKAKWETAYKIRDLGYEIKSLTERNKILEYELKYLYELYPEIEDAEIELDEIEPIEEISSTGWLTKEEWDNLSSIEKNTLAFERYKNRHKTKWQIGRDFEMYAGYQFELNGYTVEYHGIEKGFEDLGIDLIARKNNETKLVQCKYWSTKKNIHENHICQLFGTSIKYQLEHQNEKVTARFICHNELSDVAKEFAKKLGIEYFENVPIGDYPAVKCCDNYDKQTMIYHLPFDLNYDKIVNCKKFMTVEEAEKAGYRRAYKWNNN